MYSHKFYIASIKEFPKMMQQDSFECDNKKYFWMTMAELERDSNVQKKNEDILQFVKELV